MTTLSTFFAASEAATDVRVARVDPRALRMTMLFTSAFIAEMIAVPRKSVTMTFALVFTPSRSGPAVCQPFARPSENSSSKRIGERTQVVNSGQRSTPRHT